MHPWLFLTFYSIEIAEVRGASLERYLNFRRSICYFISSSAEYAWQELSGVAVIGFFAKIVSILSVRLILTAVEKWQCAMATCNAFAEKPSVFFI